MTTPGQDKNQPENAETTHPMAEQPSDPSTSPAAAPNKLDNETLEAIDSAVDESVDEAFDEQIEPAIDQAVNSAVETAFKDPVNPSRHSLTPEIFEQYTMKPEGVWPPPIFIKRNVGPRERFYMEYRWFSEWSFFDKKAAENKKRYLRYQWIIGVGSVAVPVLVGINPTTQIGQDLLYLVTVVISLSVAIAAAIENIYKYGENWRSYRQAAEELKQEKSLYDVGAGRYQSDSNAFLRFAERCEEIVAQQNGRWIKATEQAQQQAKEQTQDFLDNIDDTPTTTPTTSTTPPTSVG